MNKSNPNHTNNTNKLESPNCTRKDSADESLDFDLLSEITNIVQATATDSILEFSQQHQWKIHLSRYAVQRFLSEFISSTEMLFDIHDPLGRLATAVLLDKIKNPANYANLEILGMRADANEAAVIKQFINFAKDKLPATRAGFQFVIPENSSELATCLPELGLQPYYNTYSMRRPNLEDLIKENSYLVNTPTQIIKANTSDCHEIYQVLCETFALNLDTSIPEESSWKLNFLKSPKSHYYLWQVDKKILGYAHLFLSEDNSETEISTLGVLPQARGQGIGQHLINHCLNQSIKLGSKSCYLNVAAANSKALGIYLKAGFNITEKFQCFKMSNT